MTSHQYQRTRDRDDRLSVFIVCCTLFTLLFAGPAPGSQQDRKESARRQQQQQEELSRTYRQLETFSTVLSILRDNYVEEVDTAEALDGAIRGLLHNLDPHSSWLSPEEFKDLQEETNGHFTGIGIEVTVKNDRLTVVSPIDGTPAEKAGLKAEDIITAIDDEEIETLGAFPAIDKLRGPEGSTVNLRILRKGWEQPKEFTITRADIPLESVEARFLSPGLVYARITRFQAETGADLREILSKLKATTPIEGLILDLRNNPGGLLGQAVEVVDIFLNSGIIVSTRGRRADQNSVYRAHNNSLHADYPLVVLINEGSASASEIVAGAVQAHKRGILVGRKSFGKGSVQIVIPLRGGAGLRLTTAKYYTPDNRSIQAQGILPDVEVAQSGETKAADNKQKRTKEADLPGHLHSDSSDESTGRSPAERRALQATLEADKQLLAAWNILKSLRLYTRQKEAQQ